MAVPHTRASRGGPAAATAPGPQVLPLSTGSSGRAVVDLQLRLTKLGLSSFPDAEGSFLDGTEAAVRAFQADRGLRPDGICGRQTWSSLVEAGFSLGDRLLYRRTPMMHGDDVAELQRRLSNLGFDSGGVDGIFGDATAVALADFQRNSGLASDGIFGSRSLAEMGRLALRPAGDDLVSNLRDRVRAASAPTGLAGRKIAVGEQGGFSVGVRATCRRLSVAGAFPLPLHHPDESRQAAEANIAKVDCYIGIRLEPEHSSVITSYYRGYRYESETSRTLADLLHEELVQALQLGRGGSTGMALPILRETQMPAVLIELGAPQSVAASTPRMASSIVRSLGQWMRLAWDRG